MYLIDLNKVDKQAMLVYKEGKWYEVYDGFAVEAKPLVVDTFLSKDQIERIKRIDNKIEENNGAEGEKPNCSAECELEEEKQ